MHCLGYMRENISWVGCRGGWGRCSLFGNDGEGHQLGGAGEKGVNFFQEEGEDYQLFGINHQLAGLIKIYGC